MKRKGKKTFRGMPEQHAASAARGLKFTRDYIRGANKILKRERLSRADCGDALAYLRDAERDTGRYNAEKGWANRKDVKARPFKSASSRVNKQLGKTAMLLAKKCFR